LLAYVFSHRAAGGIEIDAYEDSLRRFHRALAEAGLSGFVASSTFRIRGEYSDWYLLQSSATMDGLNAAAVTGDRAGPHDAVAGMAADGVGKLYKLAAGEHSIEAGFEVRFSKPAGMKYADLYALLQPFTAAPGMGLWRRMMVLGPPPEFCLVAPSDVALPEEMRPEVFRREPI
jgi:hypothetical protein